MDGWNTTFLLRRPIFRGELLVSGRVPVPVAMTPWSSLFPSIFGLLAFFPQHYLNSGHKRKTGRFETDVKLWMYYPQLHHSCNLKWSNRTWTIWMMYFFLVCRDPGSPSENGFMEPLILCISELFEHSKNHPSWRSGDFHAEGVIFHAHF